MLGTCSIRYFSTVLVIVVSLMQSYTASAAVVDIMLVYDSTATTWVAAHGGKEAFSADVVNRINLALQNSGLTSHSFRLAHSMSVNYATVSLNGDLTALQQGSGDFAGVHAARDTYKADLVAMLVDTGSAYGTVGLGYILSSWSGSANYGFTVNSIRSVEISHTLTHEVGHNLGADHAKNQASSPGPNQTLDDQYSAGYYFTGTNGTDYHTIMAYNSDGYGGHYEPAPLFSTPLKIYQGTVAGNAQDADNARLISQTIGEVADYRISSVVLSGLSIAGPATVAENSSATYTATAYWNDGSSADVTPVWSEDSSYATINTAGLLSVASLPSSQNVTVSATYTANAIPVSADYNVTLVREYTLSEAVGDGLALVTGGDTDWFAQTASSHGDGIAIQSGDIVDSQHSYFQTTVTGPGTLQFYWRVSSEANYDFLKFSIDAVEQPGGISGTVDWALMTFQIPEGTHTLKWVYSKDSSVSAGEDCGWVDSITWTPQPDPGNPGWLPALPAIIDLLMKNQ